MNGAPGVVAFLGSFVVVESGADFFDVGAVGADGKVFDSEGAARATAESPLARKLKGRHLQMIAIGGSIGKPGVHISPQGAYGNPIQVQASLSALARLLKLAGLPHCSSHSV